MAAGVGTFRPAVVKVSLNLGRSGGAQPSLAPAVAEDVQTGSRPTEGTSVPELVVSLVFCSLTLQSQVPQITPRASRGSPSKLTAVEGATRHSPVWCREQRQHLRHLSGPSGRRSACVRGLQARKAQLCSSWLERGQWPCGWRWGRGSGWISVSPGARRCS